MSQALDPSSDTAEAAADTRRSTSLQMQEMRIILIAGVSTGLLIGTFFLIYILMGIVAGETTTFAPPH